jgi:hypothetical protein
MWILPSGCVLLWCGLLTQGVSAMEVILAETNDFIKVTPEYSYAALTAVLPYFSGVAKKLDLVPNPINPADIVSYHALPFGDLAVSMRLNNGWAFSYKMGHVERIVDLHGYSTLQNPDKIPLYYGEVRMTTNEVVKLARDTIEKVGITNGELFTDQQPLVKGPERIGTNIVPHFEVEWINPAGGFHDVDVHINASTRRLECVSLLSKNLRLYTPKLAIAPVADPGWPSVNPDYAHRLIPLMFTAIDDYAKKLSLPIPYPLNTNNVALVKITDNGGWPHCDVVLTNGWRFVYRHTMVNGYFSPKVLLTDIYQRPFRVKDFEGKWNIDTNQAIALVKKTIAKLNYPTNNIHMDFAPNVMHMAGSFKQKIPQFCLEWFYDNTNGGLQSQIVAEVNADTRTVESLYYDDMAYWGSRPAIDVPISIKISNSR